jgi:hypothetical protein
MAHIEFMGIPFAGSSKDYFYLLKNKTRIYSVEKEEADKVVCTLCFTNRVANVKIWGDPVYSVEVSFRGYSVLREPTEEEWGSLVNDFNDYREALTEKYGYPSFVETKLERKIHRSYFDAPDYVPKLISDRDGLSCSAKFNVTGGQISLFTTIGGFSYGECDTALFICYRDKYNEEYNKNHPKSKPLDKKYNDL